MAGGRARYVPRNGEPWSPSMTPPLGPLGEYTVSALPLRPFGVPELVWPPEVCEACYQPQWSDALRDWEFVEDAARPCVACHGRRVRGLGRNGRGSR
jgi:hypothetical protein